MLRHLFPFVYLPHVLHFVNLFEPVILKYYRRACPYCLQSRCQTKRCVIVPNIVLLLLPIVAPPLTKVFFLMPTRLNVLYGWSNLETNSSAKQKSLMLEWLKYRTRVSGSIHDEKKNKRRDMKFQGKPNGSVDAWIFRSSCWLERFDM